MNRAHFNRPRHREEGVYIVILAAALSSLLIVCGLAIDSANLYLAQLRLQRAVDAGALSALKILLTKPRYFVADATKRSVSANLNTLGYSSNPADIMVQFNDAERKILVDGNLHVDFYLMNLIPGFSMGSQVSAVAESGLPTIGIELVLDYTLSMQQSMPCDRNNPHITCTKISLLRDAANQFLDDLKIDTDFVGLTIFKNTPTQAVYPIQLLTALHKAQLKNAINSTTPSGTTCISCGLEAGLSDLQAFKQNYTPSGDFFPSLFTILFTDGTPGVDNPNAYSCWPHYLSPQSGVEEAGSYDILARAIWQAVWSANRMALEGVPLYTIGLGTKVYTPDLRVWCSPAQDAPPISSSCPLYLVQPGQTCPSTETLPYPDAFQPCYVNNEGSVDAMRDVLIRRLANDPAMTEPDPYRIPAVLHPDPPFPYWPGFTMPSEEFCSNPANAANANCIYRDNCLPRIGPQYPQALGLVTPYPAELDLLFDKILADIRKKARLVR